MIFEIICIYYVIKFFDDRRIRYVKPEKENLRIEHVR